MSERVWPRRCFARYAVCDESVSFLKLIRPFFPFPPRQLRKLGISVQCEGLQAAEADWIVLEAHECMIHIFDPATRAAHSIDEQLRRLDASTETIPDQCTMVQQLAASVPRRLKRLRQPSLIGQFQGERHDRKSGNLL